MFLSVDLLQFETFVYGVAACQVESLANER